MNPWRSLCTGIWQKSVADSAKYPCDAYLELTSSEDYCLSVTKHHVLYGTVVVYEEAIEAGERLKTRANEALRKAGFVPYRAKG